jgi:hypothetical protein
MAPLVQVSRLAPADIATARQLYAISRGRHPRPIRAVRSRVRAPVDASAQLRALLSPLGHAHLGAHGAEHDVAVEHLDLPVA